MNVKLKDNETLEIDSEEIISSAHNQINGDLKLSLNKTEKDDNKSMKNVDNNAITSNEIEKPLFITDQLWIDYRQSFPWLHFAEKKFFCTFCQDALKTEDPRLSMSVWVSGATAATSKPDNYKRYRFERHCQSQNHVLALQIISHLPSSPSTGDDWLNLKKKYNWLEGTVSNTRCGVCEEAYRAFKSSMLVTIWTCPELKTQEKQLHFSLEHRLDRHEKCNNHLKAVRLIDDVMKGRLSSPLSSPASSPRKRTVMTRAVNNKQSSVTRSSLGTPGTLGRSRTQSTRRSRSSLPTAVNAQPDIQLSTAAESVEAISAPRYRPGPRSRRILSILPLSISQQQLQTLKYRFPWLSAHSSSSLSCLLCPSDNCTVDFDRLSNLSTISKKIISHSLSECHSTAVAPSTKDTEHATRLGSGLISKIDYKRLSSCGTASPSCSSLPPPTQSSSPPPQSPQSMPLNCLFCRQSQENNQELTMHYCQSPCDKYLQVTVVVEKSDIDLLLLKDEDENSKENIEEEEGEMEQEEDIQNVSETVAGETEENSNIIREQESIKEVNIENGIIVSPTKSVTENNTELSMDSVGNVKNEIILETATAALQQHQKEEQEEKQSAETPKKRRRKNLAFLKTSQKNDTEESKEAITAGPIKMRRMSQKKREALESASQNNNNKEEVAAVVTVLKKRGRQKVSEIGFEELSGVLVAEHYNVAQPETVEKIATVRRRRKNIGKSLPSNIANGKFVEKVDGKIINKVPQIDLSTNNEKLNISTKEINENNNEIQSEISIKEMSIEKSVSTLVEDKIEEKTVESSDENIKFETREDEEDGLSEKLYIEESCVKTDNEIQSIDCEIKEKCEVEIDKSGSVLELRDEIEALNEDNYEIIPLSELSICIEKIKVGKKRGRKSGVAAAGNVKDNSDSSVSNNNNNYEKRKRSRNPPEKLREDGDIGSLNNRKRTRVPSEKLRESTEDIFSEKKKRSRAPSEKIVEKTEQLEMTKQSMVMDININEGVTDIVTKKKRRSKFHIDKMSQESIKVRHSVPIMKKLRTINDLAASKKCRSEKMELKMKRKQQQQQQQCSLNTVDSTIKSVVNQSRKSLHSADEDENRTCRKSKKKVISKPEEINLNGELVTAGEVVRRPSRPVMTIQLQLSPPGKKLLDIVQDSDCIPAELSFMDRMKRIRQLKKIRTEQQREQMMAVDRTVAEINECSVGDESLLLVKSEEIKRLLHSEQYSMSDLKNILHKKEKAKKRSLTTNPTTMKTDIDDYKPGNKKIKLELSKKADLFGCDVCQLKFRSLRARDLHVTAEHKGSKPFKCSMCDMTVSTHFGLRKHAQKYHSDNFSLAVFGKENHVDVDFSFQCHFCPSQFTSKSGMSHHITSIHRADSDNKNKSSNTVDSSNAIPPPIVVDEFLDKLIKADPINCGLQCPICNETMFNGFELAIHTIEHEREKDINFDANQFACPKCCRLFFGPEGKTYLKDHYNIIHLQKPHPSCDECKSEFPSTWCYYEHKRTVKNCSKKTSDQMAALIDPYEPLNDPIRLAFVCSRCQTLVAGEFAENRFDDHQRDCSLQLAEDEDGSVEGQVDSVDNSGPLIIKE